VINPELFRALIDELRPAAADLLAPDSWLLTPDPRDLLELACGTGFFTADLARHAQSVTAVNASDL
jgi:ubiquinone/menaquinone biosynthesis C-methylase UbiE